jgi:hypothetical protein
MDLFTNPSEFLPQPLLNIIAEYSLDDNLKDVVLTKDLAIIKWYHKVKKLSKQDYLKDYYGNYKFDTISAFACKNNCLDIIQWLYEDIKFTGKELLEKDNSFIAACSHGNLQIAQWLYKTFGSKVVSGVGNYYAILTVACNDNYLELAKWLCSIFVLSKIQREDYLSYLNKSYCNKTYTTHWVIREISEK